MTKNSRSKTFAEASKPPVSFRYGVTEKEEMMAIKEYDIYTKELIVNPNGFGWKLSPDGDEIGIAINYFEGDGSSPRKPEILSSDAVPYIIESLVRITALSYPDEIPQMIKSLTRALALVQGLNNVKEEKR